MPQEKLLYQRMDLFVADGNRREIFDLRANLRADWDGPIIHGSHFTKKLD
jgi:hypothetical protein